MLVRGVSLMHALIASPFLDEFLVLRPGSVSGIKLPHRYWRDLQQTAPTGPCPDWLSDAVRRRWPDLDISGRALGLAHPRRRLGRRGVRDPLG
jgi:hypothetical protein